MLSRTWTSPVAVPAQQCSDPWRFRRSSSTCSTYNQRSSTATPMLSRATPSGRVWKDATRKGPENTTENTTRVRFMSHDQGAGCSQVSMPRSPPIVSINHWQLVRANRHLHKGPLSPFILLPVFTLTDPLASQEGVAECIANEDDERQIACAHSSISSSNLTPITHDNSPSETK